MGNANEEADFWKGAITYAEKTVRAVKLNARYAGDTAQVKEDMIQDCLVAIAEAIKTHGSARDPVQMKSLLRSVVNNAIGKTIFFINRQIRHELGASAFLENMGGDGMVEDEDEEDIVDAVGHQEPEMAPDAADEIIRENENEALKASITCLSKEMQAVVLLHNDGFSFTEIARKMNFSRERPRQLYHEYMRKLREHIAQPDKNKAELPLGYPQGETMLYATQEEKLSELRYRTRSTRGNISNATRAMRQAGKSGIGQLSLF